MDLLFYGEQGNVVLCFQDHEKKNAEIILRAIIEDERAQGNPVPKSVTEEFFREFNTGKTEGFLFTLKYINLAIRFVHILIVLSRDYGADTEKLEEILTRLTKWQLGNYMLQ